MHIFGSIDIVLDIILWMLLMGGFIWLMDWCFGGTGLTEKEMEDNHIENSLYADTIVPLDSTDGDLK